MPKRKAKAVWEGNLTNGTGRLSLESGLFRGPYSFGSRFRSSAGTNPEELIAAAHAGCFSMALSAMLTEGGYEVKEIGTTASVQVEEINGSFEIDEIVLTTEARVNGIDDEGFMVYANKAKEGCPVSKALKAVKTIRLEARLL